MRVEHHAGLHAVGADVLQAAVQMSAGLVVYGNVLGGGVAQHSDVAVGVYYHKVYVQGFSGLLRNVADDRETEGDIGYEDSVHHIQVDVVALGGVEHLQGLAQTGEVRGEDGGGYLQMTSVAHDRRIIYILG